MTLVIRVDPDLLDGIAARLRQVAAVLEEIDLVVHAADAFEDPHPERAWDDLCRTTNATNQGLVAGIETAARALEQGADVFRHVDRRLSDHLHGHLP